MIIVCDTNVLISATHFPGSPPDEVIKLAREGFAELAISLEILSEFKRVLKKKFGASKEDIKETIESIKEIAIIVKPTEKIDLIKRDPTDNKILECTLKAEADYIISGDTKHLHPLKEFQGIPILSPAQFLVVISK
ncbi:putative toxin-antitoxin system toxin component, PIN family [bacterium]|nr:putative toxin-antitoxin system toxin component, PIN family [bacterium]